tara:strand:- start:155 stop:427 length:273 start_codon:yes stop_codon:yes gene_type:complete
MPKKQTKKHRHINKPRRSKRLQGKRQRQVLIIREKAMKSFINELEKLNKCRIKYCRKYGRSNKSDECVKKHCKPKLSSVNLRNKEYLSSI